MTTHPPSCASTQPEQNAGQKLWRVGTLTYTTAGLVILFAWLLWGDFAWSMKERSMVPLLQLLLKRFSASDLLTGVLVSSLPAGVALIFSPIISYKSDRFRSRWGRRIPFLLFTTPITALTMMGLASSPWLGERLHLALGAHSPGINSCTLFFFGVCWTIFEFATIAANALFGALVNDVVPQAVIGRFFGMFRVLSLIAGMIFNRWIFGKAETYYAWIFVGMGLLYGIGFTIMCLTVKEGEYPPPPSVEDVHGKRQGFLPAAKTYFHECFGHPYYLWYFAGSALATVSMSPVYIFGVTYAKTLGLSTDDYGKYMFWTFLISLCLAYPLGVIADRIHALRLTIISLAVYSAAMFWGGAFARNPSNFAIALIAFGVISGIFWTAVAGLPQRLLPRSRFAEMAAALGIINSVCAIALPFALGAFLDYTKHVYRYTFVVSGVLSLLGLIIFCVLHRKFMALGGPKNYVAPGETIPAN